jgi:hypothetical protein
MSGLCKKSSCEGNWFMRTLTMFVWDDACERHAEQTDANVRKTRTIQRRTP